jgi:hypothetical protein
MVADTQTTQSRRSSIMILDLLGILGGFYEAIFIFLGAFAYYLSSKFFQGNIAKSYFLKKKTPCDLDEIE